MKMCSSRRTAASKNCVVVFVLALLVLGQTPPARAQHADDGAKYLYIWAGHVNHAIADFLAVIDFDEDSPGYGQVINTVPLPARREATFNEPHHMHLSADGSILGCGGLLSVLSGQPGIFFFDTSDPRNPRFLFSTSDKFSSITDDFFPLPQGGFLITQMGSANGDAPGAGRRVRSQAPPGRLVARSRRPPTGSTRTVFPSGPS